jgi:ATP-dependent Clp protease ATP-binding subunit ClpA
MIDIIDMTGGVRMMAKMFGYLDIGGFVGREEELHKLHSILPQRNIIIVGGPGIGKTWLAAKYIERDGGDDS